eukprot:gnl/Spiro4/18571_TR9956_c0_g1_i1.p1 gnl/Spiro4/18571_TR9956_c0_g1~~gnl/Spiro4/18571_TR9956_c0_g1_i1.p1  ORF type:complete len:369 (-),score=84.64 gnl/Spiro4/18571_TR9956_c0_g1_i1:217-1323(-)
MLTNLGEYNLVCAGDLVILFQRYDALIPVHMTPGQVLNARGGSFPHSHIIGKPYGSKIFATGNGSGWMFVLYPTPELWTLSLAHRTQILYVADISLIVMMLELRPKKLVLESGTGSGSLSHAIARAVAPTGHLFTFEFNEYRFNEAREDFRRNGLGAHVSVVHRDVLADGFGLRLSDDVRTLASLRPALCPSVCEAVDDLEFADAIFLDLPRPWDAVVHAKKVLRPNARLCSFSPCIEQVGRTTERLRSLGFVDVTTLEVLLRTFECRQVELELPQNSHTVDERSEPHAKRQRTVAPESYTDDTAGAENPPVAGSSPPEHKTATRVARKSLTVTKPYQDARGHTGYLTFACKAPSPAPAPSPSSSSSL